MTAWPQLACVSVFVCGEGEPGPPPPAVSPLVLQVAAGGAGCILSVATCGALLKGTLTVCVGGGGGGGYTTAPPLAHHPQLNMSSTLAVPLFCSLGRRWGRWVYPECCYLRPPDCGGGDTGCGPPNPTPNPPPGPTTMNTLQMQLYTIGSCSEGGLEIVRSNLR